MRTEKNIERLIDVAMGREKADLVIKNAHIFNVFTGQFQLGDLAVDHGWIAGVGDYEGRDTHDAGGGWLCPGFFDAHVHIESSMVSPAEFAKTLVALGTTSVVADPHEIANVAGLDGLRYMLEATENIPINVFIMLPSCVPASPLEWGGAKLTAADLAPFLSHPRVLGLGEMMNFPGVIAKDPQVMAKLKLATAAHIDGHGPGLSGRALNAYAATGIASDHECVSAEEGAEKIAAGLGLMLRQGSAGRNLLDLLPAVNAHTAQFCMLATDDRQPADLLAEGHINYLLRLAVNEGHLDPALALRLASFNPAAHFGLKDLGALAPGFRADMLLLPDLKDFKPSRVWKDGRLAAENGRCLLDSPPPQADCSIRRPLRLAELKPEDFQVPASGSRLRVIGLKKGQIVTEELIISPQTQNGFFIADPEADLVKLAVAERHRGSGRLSLGFLKGLGLKRGALASTVAHDSHHLIIAGLSDEDMALAAEEIKRLGGGLVLVAQGRVLGSLALPLGGLMSDLSLTETAEALEKLQLLSRDLGLGEGHDPFMTLAFMSLSVIPKLKLTEAGLVDVDKFALVDLVLD